MALTSNLEPATTSSQSKSDSKGSRGFTLIEILIVLAIIVMVLSIGIPVISQITMQRLASTTRRFVGSMRSVRNDAILINKLHRLVVDIDNQAWWVEAQGRMELLPDPAMEKKDTKPKDKDKEPKSNFALVDKYGKKPNALPTGVIFQGVLKEQGGLISKGTAYIHFFPNGYAEKAIIYINKEGSSGEGYSLALKAASGRVEIFNRRINSFQELGQ